MDLYILAGQSNMAGRGELDEISERESNEESTTVSGVSIVSFDDDESSWRPAKDPLHKDKPDKVGVGPGLSFAQELARLGCVTEGRSCIGLVPCAVGGTSLDEWTDSLIGPCLEKVLRAAKQCESEEMGFSLKGLLWLQGESDSTSLDSAKGYLDKLVPLMTKFRDFFNRRFSERFVPILVGGMAEFLGQRNDDRYVYFTVVNQQLSEFPETMPLTAFVPAKDLSHKGDFLHLDSDSARQFGVRFARAYAKLVGHGVKRSRMEYVHRMADMTKEKAKQTTWQQWAGVVGLCVVAYVAWAEWRRRSDLTTARDPSQTASSSSSAAGNSSSSASKS